MGAEIWKARYRFVFGPVAQGQFRFIDDNVYRSDDGTYELSSEDYRGLRQKMEELEKLYGAELKPLFQVFGKEIRKGKGHLSFRIFV